MSAENDKSQASRTDVATVDAHANAPSRTGLSLHRRSAVMGLAAIAAAPSALAACGGGGGGGGDSGDDGNVGNSGSAPVVTGTFSAEGFTTSDQNRFGFLSDGQSRDHEVTTWTTNGRVYLRIAPSGRALFFEVSGNSLTIGIAIGLSETSYYPTDYRLLMTGTMPSSSAANPTFTFGVFGFDIYAKLDGVEFLRVQDFHHMESGRIGVKQPNGFTFAPITGTHFENRPLLSNLSTQTYDVRDFGFRAVQTTGSMTAGSRILTLRNAADIRVGDFVIVEIGQEPGGGQRGTVGVGGVWPTLSYESAVAMSVDLSKPVNTLAWRRDTGDVYRWSGSSWVPQTNYYLAKAVPRSLHARVLAKSPSGTQLTLDASAAVSVNNANVHLDVVPFVNFLTQHTWYKFGGAHGELQSLIPSQRTILLPEGDFPVCGTIILNRGLGMSNLLMGAGRDRTILRAPQGVACATIYSTQVNGATPRTIVRDLHLIGNARDVGFGLNWADSAIPYGYGSSGMEWELTSASPAANDTNITGAFGHGIIMSVCQNAEVRDVNVTDVFMMGVGASYCTDCNAHNAFVRMTEGLRSYVQWAILWADSEGGRIVDCTVESNELIAGMETFRSRSVQFVRPRMINATFASNSSGDFLVQEADVVIRSMSQAPQGSFSEFNPIFNINSNMGPSPLLDLGGRIVDCRVVQEGYVNAANDSLFVVAVNAGCPNVSVAGGRFEAPDYVVGSNLGGSVGVNSTGANTDVSNLVVVGRSQYAVTGNGYRNIHLAGASTATSGSTITNCTAGDTYVAV